ncbi:MAG: hypothetical protein KDK34_05995, partial [Leptospiraceae bacterium]|nr:hypothetical protein [Leptospiraceae bacterium]
RNVNKRPYPEFVKSYAHNGVFKSLEEIVHFYNTRDVAGAGWNGIPWAAPEVAENVNVDELGNLGLSEDEEAALVAFLKTLDDGYKFPYMLLAEDDIEIHGATLSGGNIHANVEVQFKKGNYSTYPINVSAVKRVDIEDRNTISGDVTAPKVYNSSAVTGTVYRVEVEKVLLPELPHLKSNHHDRDIFETVSLQPGVYGDITVKKNGTLNLSAGKYYCKQLEIEKNGTVNLDVSNGDIELYIVEELEFKSRGEFNAIGSSGPNPKVTIWSGYSGTMKMPAYSVFNGCNLIAPKAGVRFYGNSFFKGSITADEIELQEGAIVVGYGSSVLPKIAPQDDDADVMLTNIPTEYALEQNYPNPFNP